MNYIGIDIGGTAVKLGIIDDCGNVLASDSYPVAFDQYETPIFDTVVKSLALFLKDKSGIYEGIGVSATGMIDTVQGLVAGTAGHIKNWRGSRIKAILEEIYHIPVTVLNDANCAALAEKWIGAAKHVKNAVVVTIGTGVGGGVIVNSEILTGAHGFAGELGHFSIRNQGKPCTCGNIGCYEQYASTTALIRMVREAVELGKIDITVFPQQKVNGKTIFELLKTNSNLQSIVEEWMNYVADGLVGLVHIFNPSLILIGGGISVQDQLFIQPLREIVLKRVMPTFAVELDLKAAELGNDAGMIGAVYYCIRQRT